MGNYAVPEYIRVMNPKGTMVKKINNKFYVYEYKSSKDENGKRITKMGKSIGMIKEGIGFVSYNNFLRDKEITSYEFGQYLITTSITSNVLELLLGSFNPLDVHDLFLETAYKFIISLTGAIVLSFFLSGIVFLITSNIYMSFSDYIVIIIVGFFAFVVKSWVFSKAYLDKLIPEAVIRE